MSDRPSLLVVDDEADFAEFVRAVAADMGFDVRVAGDGRRFRALFSEREPDVVVLDLVMPDEDGIELVRWLAAARYGGRVLIASGYNPLYSQMAAVLAGEDGLSRPVVLNKPVALAALREARGGPASSATGDSPG